MAFATSWPKRFPSPVVLAFAVMAVIAILKNSGSLKGNFHQRQQRAYTSTSVEERVAAVGNFYNSIDSDFTRTFLKTYQVKYIIVGQLERAQYTPEGLVKFQQFDGVYWKSIYSDGCTVIYEADAVINPVTLSGTRNLAHGGSDASLSFSTHLEY